MSADEPGTREVAHRVFAAEYDDADYSWKESDEERAPSYVITPSGAKVNRLFLVGVLTEIEDVNEDMLRARVVDPSGPFVTYAGQYQPDARTFFERADPPAFVAVTGKARTFQPEDSDRVFTSVRPESVSEVDADTRDRWIVATADATLERVGTMARVLRGDLTPAETTGTALARERYDTAPVYLDALRDLAVSAAEVVAGDRDEVDPLSVDPDRPGEADLDRLAALVDEPHVEAAPEPDAAATAGEPASDASAAGDGPVDADEPATGEPDTGEAPAEPTATSEAAGSAAGDDPDVTETTTGDADEEPIGDFESGDGLGDFDAGDSPDGAGADADAGDADGAADPGDDGQAEVSGAPDEMYELDEDERREVEEEYGTEFSTGSEVDPAGESDVETPAPDDDPDAAPGGSDTEGTVESEGTADQEATTEFQESADQEAASDGEEPGEEEPASEPEPPAEEGSAEQEADADLDEVLIDAMHDLDDGGGADREALIDRVTDATGASPEAVEDAIQDALMGGQCYEPDEESLKPI